MKAVSVLDVQHNDLQMRQAVIEISDLLIMGEETCSGSSRVHSTVVHARSGHNAADHGQQGACA